MKNKGFTLVEILVTLLIVGLLTTLIFVSIDSTQKSTSGIERKVIAQEDAKVALSLMEMEIRMASYNPQFSKGNWVEPDNCTSASSAQSYRGIQVATANTLTIQADLNGNCSVDNNFACTTDDNEIIRYNYDTDAADRHITRQVNCDPVPQTFLGASSGSTAIKTVNVINDELNIPVFRYFDGAGFDISAAVEASPADSKYGIPAIRRIDITLAVETQYKDPMKRRPTRMIYTTSVILRNHAPQL
jgi:prepilin-type N-terminal cleavage/methylation domain-containing protein